MKKFLITMVALLGVCMSANAQLVLTPDGFVSATDSTKNYIVIDVKGEQAELYKLVKGAVLSLFRSPKDVLSESFPEVLTINGSEENGIVVPKALGLKMTYDVNFTITFKFRDGKIRIDSPSFICQNTSMGNQTIELILRGSKNYGFGKTVVNTIYNKSGDKVNEKEKKSVEDYFNKVIAKIVATATQQGEEW